MVSEDTPPAVAFPPPVGIMNAVPGDGTMDEASLPLATALWFVVPPCVVLLAALFLTLRQKGE
jgi:hypothetical protein